MKSRRIFTLFQSLMLSLVAIPILALSLSATAFAFENASDWALSELNEAKILGLLPESVENGDMDEGISRAEMSTIATIGYEKLTGIVPHPNKTDYFLDTTDPLICAAYEIGLVNGYPDGTFKPEATLTRQEFFKIVSTLYDCVGVEIPPLKKDYLEVFPDRDLLASWAEEPAQRLVGLTIVQGTKDDRDKLVLAPTDHTVRQEAVIMFLRAYKSIDQYLHEERYTKEEIDEMIANANKENASDEAQALIEYAMTLIGLPYVFGANGPNAYDCSSYTQHVYGKFGYSINRVANDQAKNGTPVEKKNLQPGDMVLFQNTYSSSQWITHVGIYIGDGKFVHAANSRRGITVDTIESGYYASHYATSRRIITK